MGERDRIATRRLWELRQFPVFAAVSIGDLALLADNIAEVTYKPGSSVASAGAVPAVELVVAGELAASDRVWGPREVFGLGEVLGRRVLSAEVRATRTTRTLQLAAADVADVLEEGFGLQRAVLRELAGRVRAPVVRDEPLQDVPPQPLGLVERLFALRRVAPLRAAHVDAVAALAHVAYEVVSPPGTVLVSAGDRATRAHILLEGRLRVADALAAAGTVIGGIEVLGDLEHRETVTTATRVRTLALDAQAMFDVFEDHADLGRAVLSWLAAAAT